MNSWPSECADDILDVSEVDVPYCPFPIFLIFFARLHVQITLTVSTFLRSDIINYNKYYFYPTHSVSLVVLFIRLNVISILTRSLLTKVASTIPPVSCGKMRVWWFCYSKCIAGNDRKQWRENWLVASVIPKFSILQVAKFLVRLDSLTILHFWHLHWWNKM